MVLAPAAAVVIADSSQQYVATATYDDGSVGPAAVSFRVNGGGSIDSKGKFTAGETAGTYEVSATASDGSTQANTPVSVAAPTPTTPAPPTTTSTSSSSGILFSDDFSSGNLSKTANGWSWSPAWVDVVNGFSKDGNMGHSARFTFKGSADTSADAWSELRFKVGTGDLKEVWVTYWVYYPNGQEAVYRGPRFLHRGGTLGPTNNKFFRLFHTYAAGYLETGLDTWADGGGDGSMVGEAKTATIRSGEILRDTRIPAEIDAYRGRWLKIEIHTRAASAPGVADGLLEAYRDGERIISRPTLDIYPSLGDNYFREGYLFGWANSGFDSTTYAYISNVIFSRERLP
jgi:hypothetical protein